MSLFRILPVLMILAGGIAAAQATAPAPDTAAPPKAGFDEQTKQRLDALKANLQKAQTREFSAHSVMKIDGNGMSRTNEMQFTAAAKLPNKFFIKCEGGNLDGLVLLSDSKTLYTESVTAKKFRKEEAPEELTNLSSDGYVPPDPMLGFIVAFVESNPLAPLLDGVTSGQYVGKEAVDTVECDRMRFSHPDMDWDLWVSTGDNPVPVRLKPDISKSLAQQGAQMGSLSVEMLVSYANWKLGQELPDDRFAVNVDGFEELTEPLHPIVGKPSPGFTLNLLDGSQATLAQHEGKDIVVLDFWTTYCPQCRLLAPVVEEVMEEFKGKNVVLYAVNGGEDAALVKQFVETSGLSSTVALDTDMALSNMFDASTLPHMVIIGKDGIVQSVQTGFGPPSERRFRNALKALTAGKSLVAAAPAAQPAP